MKRTLLPALALVILTACMPLKPQNPQTPGTASGTQTSEAVSPAGEQDTPASSAAAVTPSVTERVLATGTIEIGSADAPVSLMLFTNPFCAYCSDFQQGIMPRLTADYVATGKVRVTVVPFILQKYGQSTDATKTFLCAARQNKGQAMLSTLFTAGWNTNAYREALPALGLDQNQMNECVNNEGITATINALQSVASSLDIELVPAYFLNGTKYVGLPEYADLRGQIEQILND